VSSKNTLIGVDKVYQVKFFYGLRGSSDTDNINNWFNENKNINILDIKPVFMDKSFTFDLYILYELCSDKEELYQLEIFYSVCSGRNSNDAINRFLEGIRNTSILKIEPVYMYTGSSFDFFILYKYLIEKEMLQ